MDLKIIDDQGGALGFINGRNLVHPKRGEVVAVISDNVARTLITRHLAVPAYQPVGDVESGEPVDAVAPPAQPAPAAASEPGPSSEPGTKPESRAPASWSDVPGLSNASSAVLIEKGGDLDPWTVTQEELASLLGSDRKATYAMTAVEEFRAQAAEGAK